jgi:hypothetical protein
MTEQLQNQQSTSETWGSERRQHALHDKALSIFRLLEVKSI